MTERWDGDFVDSLFDVLNKIPFFKNFSTQEKRDLSIRKSNFLRFKPGAKIIQEGDLDSSFYILLLGSVIVKKQGVEILYMDAGEFFGEMAFLGDTARTSSVVAQDPVIVLCIDKKLLYTLSCETREKIKDQCIIKLIERVDKLTERLRVRM